MIKPLFAIALLQSSATINTLAPYIVGMVVFLSIMGFLLTIISRAIKSGQLERSRLQEMLHEERMKAIEAGLPLPADSAESDDQTIEQMRLHHALWLAFWTLAFGAGVPFWSVSAFLNSHPDMDRNVSVAALVAAALASMTACICSAVVMTHKRKDAERTPAN